MRGANVLAAAREVADTAEHTLRIDMFRASDEPTVARYAAAAERGAKVTALVDPDSLPPATHARIASFATTTDYGTDPLKQHSKAVVADGADADDAQAIIATDVGDVTGRDRLDMAVRFSGHAARKLDALLALSEDAHHKDAQPVIDAARASGILLNDPRLGVHDFTDAVEQAIDGAHKTLLVTTKEFRDASMATRIAKVAGDGVDVRVISNVVAPEIADILHAAHVRLDVVAAPPDPDPDPNVVPPPAGSLPPAAPEPPVPPNSPLAPVAMHGTLIVTDGDHSLFGSLFLDHKVLYGSNHRQSREMGAALGHDSSEQVEQLVAAAYGA
jgi:hypothetical protein